MGPPPECPRGQDTDLERQVTCGEVPERICINLGIFSKGAKQRAPRKHAEPLPKMVPTPECPNEVPNAAGW
jgi:hypothetical protein